MASEDHGTTNHDAEGRRKPKEGHEVVQAYILIQTGVGQAAGVTREIAKISGVTDAVDVTGP